MRRPPQPLASDLPREAVPTTVPTTAAPSRAPGPTRGRSFAYQLEFGAEADGLDALIEPASEPPGDPRLRRALEHATRWVVSRGFVSFPRSRAP